MRHSAGMLLRANRINYRYAARLGGRLSWRPLSFLTETLPPFQTTGAMSAVGTKRTFRDYIRESAFGGKADIGEPCSSASIFESAFPRLTPPPGDNPAAALRRAHVTERHPRPRPAQRDAHASSNPSIGASTSMNGGLSVRHAARACADTGKSAPVKTLIIPAMSPAHGAIGIVSHETRSAFNKSGNRFCVRTRSTF